MIVTLLVLVGLAVAGIVGAIVAVARDGYRRVPERSPRDRIRGDL